MVVTRPHPHVLFVDDHEDTRIVMSLMLGEDGFHVDVASDAAGAFHLATQTKYDIYILDVHMPDINGIELCKDLKRLTPQVPVLFYSALNHEDLKKSAMSSGGDQYLLKPVRIEVLEAAIETCLTQAH